MTATTPLPDPSTPLDPSTAHAAFAAMLDGDAGDEAVATFLVGLAERGETAGEIAAAAAVLRERMIAIDAPGDAIDVCGTGGDGQHSLNVSTAVAIVVAACGVPVAKHGNRAASSKAGAADTLEALGLDLARASATAEQTLAELGLCFLFAQRHHPALARLAPIRRTIGRRTIFNLVGPLANPARVRRQLIGVARPDHLDAMAGAAALLGLKAMLVSGAEGLDELSIAGPTHVVDVVHGELRAEKVTPDRAGLPCHGLAAIKGGDPAFNAAALRGLLAGEAGAYRDAVLLNAAAALIVAGRAGWAEAAEDAAAAIDDGRARALLDRWVAFR